MLIDITDLEFIHSRFPHVDGWCDVESAYFTICLLNRQTEMGYDAALLEIGVYKGKFLSVLYQKAQRNHQPIIGIDTFQWSSAAEVMNKFQEIFGSADGLKLVKADSRSLDPLSVLEMTGGHKVSFVSVDGDHSAAAVKSDLQLAQNLLHEGGIVAVDDFLNPRAIGGREALTFCGVLKL
jgi:predicted O-methyltransferase YrrM